MRKNRTCTCCKTTYTYCPDCGGADRLKPYWYADFCCVECKDLWDTATKFNMQLISKEEAVEIISGLNLKDKSEYVDCVQRDLTVIFDEPKAKRAKTAKAEEPIRHEVILEEKA